MLSKIKSNYLQVNHNGILRYPYLLFMTCLLLLCNACSMKDEVIINNKIRVVVALKVESQPLQLNTGKYKNSNGDDYSIEKLAFYMSNVKFRNKQSGQVYQEPQSYHLVRLQNDNNFSFEINNASNGIYDEIEFAIGVDSLKNTTLVSGGDLDPANGMAWDWNTGYKFLLLEGRFFPKNNAQTKGLIIHVGENMNYIKYKLPINDKFEVQTNKTTTLKLQANIAEIFKTPTLIDFSVNNQIMNGEMATKIAQNYADMLTVVGVE